MRFVQRLSVELMKAQADTILTHVVNARRALSASLLRRRTGAMPDTAAVTHGSAAGCGGARGGRGPVSPAGYGRQAASGSLERRRRA